MLINLKSIVGKVVAETAIEYLSRQKNASYKDYFPMIPDDFKSDGCSYSPDRFKCCGCITEVCRVHDFLYRIGGGEDDRKAADSMLRLGIIEHAAPGALNYIKTRWIAFAYWRAVRRFGKFFFNYTDGKIVRAISPDELPAEYTTLKERAKEILEKS